MRQNRGGRAPGAPARRWLWLTDARDPDRLHVFVPSLMGAGLVVSVLILIADAMAQIGRGRRRRRQHVAGRAVAAAVGGDGDVGMVGARRPSVSVVVAGASVGLGLYVLVGSFWNYWNPADMWNGVGWIWALSTVVAGGMVAVGVGAARVAMRRPGAGSVGLLVGTPLGRDPGPVSGEDTLGGPDPPAGRLSEQ